MLEIGYIKMHRKIMHWEWYQDGNTFRVFVHLLLKANHKPKKWRGITIEKGQVVTGRKKLAEDLKLTEREIRTSLNRLKSTGEIAIKTTNKYSLVTLINWDSYQTNGENRPADRPTDRPTNDQQTTTNKNDKKEKKEKKDRGFSPPSPQEVQDYLDEKGVTHFTGEDFCNFYETTNWYRGKTKIKSWKHCIGTWRDKEASKVECKPWEYAI